MYYVYIYDSIYVIYVSIFICMLVFISDDDFQTDIISTNKHKINIHPKGLKYKPKYPYSNITNKKRIYTKEHNIKRNIQFQEINKSTQNHVQPGENINSNRRPNDFLDVCRNNRQFAGDPKEVPHARSIIQPYQISEVLAGDGSHSEGQFLKEKQQEVGHEENP